MTALSVFFNPMSPLIVWGKVGCKVEFGAKIMMARAIVEYGSAQFSVVIDLTSGLCRIDTFLTSRSCSDWKYSVHAQSGAER